MPDTVWNATSSVMVTNSIDGGSFLMLTICIIGLAALLFLINNLERYTKFWGAVSKWIFTIKYTVFGAGVTACGYGLWIACKSIASATAGIDPLWIVEAIGAYIALTIIGWIASKVVQKAKETHKQYKERVVVLNE